MYNNVFYFKKINKIGGTEQFLYEIAKKYNKYDITIIYNKADKNQLERLRKYVRCKKHKPGEIIECKNIFLNFNIDIIDYVKAEKYYFISHANYEELGYSPPILNPKLTDFIGVSQFATNKLNEYGKLLGKTLNTKKCYNPLTLEKVKKPKIIVSACRLDDEVKGGKRTLELIKELDDYCYKNPDEHYLWFIFSNPINLRISSPNVIIMPPRVDIRPYIAMASYVAQLSNDMETYCYTINEALRIWSTNCNNAIVNIRRITNNR